MDSQNTQNETANLQEEILALKQKLERCKGLLEFMDSDSDPTHTLRSALVNVQSFVSVLEILDFEINKDELKEMALDMKRSSAELLNTIDKICKTF